MYQYHDLLARILDTGKHKADRTGTGTISVFGHQMRFDLCEGFPLVTTKKLFTKAIIHELLWFLSGSTNVQYLRENGVTIWDEWADANGDLGPVYGQMWRSWPHKYGQHGHGIYEPIDQISNVVHALKTNPDSRRHIVTAWNPVTVDDCALPPCHCLFQFYVDGGEPAPDGRRTLNLQLYQRSADCFLGVPFNIASYALLLQMMAQVTGHIPGEFIHTLGDAHLYVNHLEQALLQLTRKPATLPEIFLNPDVTDLFAFRFEDIAVKGYHPHPPIKAAVAV